MILVTGGAGFIGSMLVATLNKEGRDDIVIVDRLKESEKWKNLRPLRYEAYIRADSFFMEANEAFWQKIELILHMGACSSTTERNMDYLMTNNLEFSQVLFDRATKYNIPMVYASSAATYGLGEQGYDDDELKLDKLRPLNRYGYSKQLFDQWVLKQKKRPDIWYGIKFFNVFGPNEYHKGGMRSVVHQAFDQINEKGRVSLFRSHIEGIGDGEQKRDFIYVKDAARAIFSLLALKNPETSGIYNLGTGQARTFNDLVMATFKAMNRDVQIDYMDMPYELRAQYQYFTEANMTKFTNVLPQFTFRALENSVRDYVVSHLVKDDSHIQI